MALTVSHPFVSAKPDGVDATLIQPSNWNDTHSIVGVQDVVNGGTGANNVADARTNLGLGSMATQSSSNVAITGGSISGITLTSLDTNTTFQDDVDPTKQLQFQLSGLSGGVTRVLTIPDYNATLATLAGTEVLTNKTLTAPAINGIVTTTGLTLPAATVGDLNGTTIPTSKTLLVTTDIGSTVQAYDADIATWAGITPGTGVGTALAVNIGTAGSVLVNGGVLGTPSSGTVTNLTGTASININGTVGATTPAAGTFTTVSSSGNLAFTGASNRITGDFSNSTAASRVIFQTSTVNGDSYISAIPNGSGNTSLFGAFNSSNITNSSATYLYTGATYSAILADKTGTGTYLPLVLSTGGSEKLRIDTSGHLGLGLTPSAWGQGRSIEVGLAGSALWNSGSQTNLSLWCNGYFNAGSKFAGTGYASRYQQQDGVHSWQTSTASGTAGNAASLTALVSIDVSGNLLVSGTGTGSLGYGTGAGGTVTQSGSRAGTVILNKPTGDITLFTAAGLATATTFTVSNSLVVATDVPTVAVRSATNKYIAVITNVAAGSFDITFFTTGGTASDTPVFHFDIAKGAAS